LKLVADRFFAIGNLTTPPEFGYPGGQTRSEDRVVSTPLKRETGANPVRTRRCDRGRTPQTDDRPLARRNCLRKRAGKARQVGGSESQKTCHPVGDLGDGKSSSATAIAALGDFFSGGIAAGGRSRRKIARIGFNLVETRCGRDGYVSEHEARRGTIAAEGREAE